MSNGIFSTRIISANAPQTRIGIMTCYTSNGFDGLDWTWYDNNLVQIKTISTVVPVTIADGPVPLGNYGHLSFVIDGVIAIKSVVIRGCRLDGSTVRSGISGCDINGTTVVFYVSAMTQGNYTVVADIIY